MRSHASRLLTCVLLLGHVACDAPAKPTCTGHTVRLNREKILTFGTDFAYPPFAFDHPDTGAPAGFEVELAELIAQQLGAKLLLVNRNSAALIPGLLAHRHDLAASALLDTPELRREVCVSAPYLDADLGLLARSGPIPSLTGAGDLEGRAIAVVTGSRGEEWLRDNGTQTTRIVRVETAEDLLTVLRARAVDAVINDVSVLRFEQVRANDVVVVAEITTGDHYVLAAGPDNRGLIELVDTALETIRAKGQLAALDGKWFGG